MAIELVRPWKRWKAGKQFALMTRPVERLLIKRGIARELDAEQMGRADTDGRDAGSTESSIGAIERTEPRAGESDAGEETGRGKRKRSRRSIGNADRGSS